MTQVVDTGHVVNPHQWMWSLTVDLIQKLKDAQLRIYRCSDLCSENQKLCPI